MIDVLSTCRDSADACDVADARPERLHFTCIICVCGWPDTSSSTPVLLLLTLV